MVNRFQVQSSRPEATTELYESVEIGSSAIYNETKEPDPLTNEASSVRLNQKFLIGFPILCTIKTQVDEAESAQKNAVVNLINSL